MNPIEQVFAKLKNLVRPAEPRDREVLWGTIRKSLGAFTPSDGANDLAHAGSPRMV